MTAARAFRGFRFPAEVILWAVRWCLQFPVSYRHLGLRHRPAVRLPARHPTSGSWLVSAPTHAEPAPDRPDVRLALNLEERHA
jgi:transposase-like protein